MARRNGMRKNKKIEPAVQTLWFGISTAAGTTSTNYIDLSQVASLVNRRFYRQGINWAVSNIETFNQSTVGSGDPTPPGRITLSKLPTTWVMSNAWEKSFRAWQRMNNEALEESESVRPKFLDFKIYADADHHDAGFAANLLPASLAGGFAAGEWASSKIHVPIGVGAAAATAEYEFIATGASYPGASTATTLDAVSLIEGYAASRGLPDVLDPNTPSDASDATGADPENWMGALFSEGTTQDSDVLEDMITENNLAPYPFENDGVNTDTQYPNGANQGSGLEIHDYGFITATTIGNETHLMGGQFPCGLMRFDVANDSDATELITLIGIRLVPGSHRGYLCEPMTEL